MTNANKAQLIRQLRDQARVVEGLQGAELMLSLLDTCGVLLDAAAGCGENADAGEFEGLYAIWLGIAGRVGEFARQAERRISPEAAQALRGGTAEQLAAARARAEEKERRLLADKEELKRLCGENAARESRLEANRSALQQEEDRSARLNEALEQYSDRRVQALREQNGALQAEIDRSRPEAEALLQERQALQMQLETLQGQIEAVPEEIRALRQSYLENEETLRQLNDAAALYSPENQAALQAQIEALGPEVEQRMSIYQDLAAKAGRLQADRATLEEEYPALRASVIGKIEETLHTLENSAAGRLQEAQQLKRQVDTLRENLEQCNALRSAYQSWLDADETNLRALMAVLDDTESATLRKTLDPARCDRVQQLTDTVRDGLQQLEQLLDRARAAYEKDVAQVKERAGRRE